MTGLALPTISERFGAPAARIYPTASLANLGSKRGGSDDRSGLGRACRFAFRLDFLSQRRVDQSLVQDVWSQAGIPACF